MPPNIQHIFRAHSLIQGTGERGPRGTLTVCRSSERSVLVFFDYQENGEPKRKVKNYPFMHMLDKDAAVVELPEAERELLPVRLVVFGEKDDPIYGLGDAYEVYSRLPVPPEGAAIRNTVASVSARAKAVT